MHACTYLCTDDTPCHAMPALLAQRAKGVRGVAGGGGEDGGGRAAAATIAAPHVFAMAGVPAGCRTTHAACIGNLLGPGGTLARAVRIALPLPCVQCWIRAHDAAEVCVCRMWCLSAGLGWAGLGCVSGTAACPAGRFYNAACKRIWHVGQRSGITHVCAGLLGVARIGMCCERSIGHSHAMCLCWTQNVQLANKCEM